MSTRKPASLSWLWPTGVALAIIAGFSFWVHSRSAKPPGPASSQPVQEAMAAAGNKAKGLDLTGIVRSAEGQPITNASIFIYTAQPRSGPGFT